jgi:hypothetical protein
MPATFEELGELTFAEALEAFDDRYEEHTTSEEERVRNQADPNWWRDVMARRKDSKVGVKYSEADLARLPEPYPAADYSRKWELEHDLLETRNCIRTASELIEEFTAGTSDHRRYHGHACTLEQAVKKERDSIHHWEEEVKPLEWELAWLNSSTSFDFTGESYQSDPEAMYNLCEEGDAVNFQVDVEQGSCPEWFDITKEQITFMRKLDRAIYHAGDAIIPEYNRDANGEEKPGEPDPCVAWLVELVGSRARLELLAAGRELAKRDPTFWPRLRDIGPTPGLLREANHILRGAGRQEGSSRKTAAVGSRSMHFLSRAHARTSRCSSPRVRGSRRVASRPAGGGGGGDPPGGGDEPEPGEKPRRFLDVVGARTQWDVTMTGFGVTIGSGVMGARGMLIGGVAGYLWGRRRWPGDN